MTSLDAGLQTIRSAAYRVNLAWDRLGKAIKRFMPTGLYARALLIIIAPMVVLQSVVAFVFMERHWNTVTRRLSQAVVQDIATLIDVYRTYPQDKDRTQLRKIAQQRLGLVVDFLPINDMPPPGPKPFFSLLDQTLSVQRATSVANYLMGKGLSQQRFIVTGAGESRPIASNDTEEGRAANRRVEITLVPVHQ